MGLIGDQSIADKPECLCSHLCVSFHASIMLSLLLQPGFLFLSLYNGEWLLGPQTKFLSLMFNKHLPEGGLSSFDSKLSGSVWPMCPLMQLPVACKGEVTVYNHDFSLLQRGGEARRRGNPCRMTQKPSECPWEVPSLQLPSASRRLPN